MIDANFQLELGGKKVVVMLDEYEVLLMKHAVQDVKLKQDKDINFAKLVKSLIRKILGDLYDKDIAAEIEAKYGPDALAKFKLEVLL